MSTAPTARYSLEDIEDFLDDLRSFKDDFSRRLHLAEHYPHVPKNFWKRFTPSMVLKMDPIQFAALLHGDPTGERAVRNVMKEAA